MRVACVEPACVRVTSADVDSNIFCLQIPVSLIALGSEMNYPRKAALLHSVELTEFVICTVTYDLVKSGKV